MDSVLTRNIYEINGIHLHVVEAGDKNGVPILFLHGFPEHWYGWKNQIDHFAALGYRVIVPDQRGYNLSAKPADVQAYKVENLIQDIVSLIDHLMLKDTFLIGHDWGGIVSWQLAMYHPRLFRKIVIVNVPHPGALRKKLLPSQLFKSWYIFFFQLPLLPELLNGSNNFAFMAKSMLKSSLPGTFSPYDMSVYRQAWKQGISSMINWYRAMRKSLLFRKKPSEFPMINKPLLLIWGKKDAFLSYELAPLSLEFCTNGQLITYEDATHWVHHERSERFNNDISSFIEK